MSKTDLKWFEKGLQDKTEQLKTVYQSWSFAYYNLRSEETTLKIYKDEYKKRISKRIPKEMQDYTLEQWARFAYNQNLKMVKMTWESGIDPDKYNAILGKTAFPFVVTALLECNEQPYAYIVFLGSGFVVSFIDEYNRTYMSYNFEAFRDEDNTHKGCVFLDGLSVRYYHDEKDEDGSWDYDYTDYEFSPDGKIRKVEEINGIESVYESDRRVNVESNWQKYPEFGDWLPLFNMKRWKEGELTDLLSAKYAIIE